MSNWFRPLGCTQPCVNGPRATRTFTYDALTHPYPTDTIPYSLLQGGIDQLVIDGTIPAPNTVVYMPPHTALLDLFSHPRPDDQIALDVSNPGLNSVDLTIYKANAEPTGSPEVVYTQPIRIATIPASSVVRLYLRVIDATPETGVADVKMLASLEGGTGSVPTPVITLDMSDGSTALLAQQIVQSTVGQSFELMFTNGLAPSGVVRLPVVPDAASGPAQMLYANCDTSGPPLVSPLLAGDSFDFVLTSTNASGYNLAWSTGGVAGVQLTGSTTQPTGTTYQVKFRFLMAGAAPEFLGSTLAVDLANACASRVGELVRSRARPTPTTDFLKCDGSVYAQSAYPSLYSKIGLLPKFTTSVQSAMKVGLPMIAYSPTLSLYVSIQSTGVNSAYQISTDGTNWLRSQGVLANSSAAASHIIWSTLLGKFIVCTESSAVHVSSDGYNFSAVETYTGVKFKHIADSGTVLCAYGAQPLSSPDGGGAAANAVWMTTDPALLNWTRVPVPGASSSGAVSNDLYYATAQNIFCLSLDAPTTPFSISNTVPPGAVTVGTRTAATGSILQFASDANAIYAVVNGPGVFFSTDSMLTAWQQTLSTGASTGNFTGVAVNPGATGTEARLVAVATAKGIATSQRTVGVGTTMLTFGTSATTVTNTGEYLSYNPNFAAAYRYVRVYSGSGGAIALSPDLSTWYNPDTSLSTVTATFNCTAANPNAGGRTVIGGSSGVVYSSSDGSSWTLATGTTGANPWLHLIWSTRLARFVAVSSSASFYSVTGATSWTSGGATLANTNGIADGPAGCIVVTSNAGSGNNYAMWNDVDTWTPLQLNCGIGIDVINGVACVGTTYCIVTQRSNVWTTTTPAVASSWVRQQGWKRSTYYSCIVALGSRIAIYSGNTAVAPCMMAMSTDGGVTFSALTIPQQVQSLSYVNGQVVAMGPLGDFALSTDGGFSWTCTKVRISSGTRRVFFLNGRYFIGTTDRGLMVSADGQDWSFPGDTSNITVCPTGPAMGNKIFGAGGMAPTYTTDGGSTWTCPKNYHNPTYNEMAYSPALNLVVAIASNGTVLTSADGDTWISRAMQGSYIGLNASTYTYSTVIWAAGAGMFVGCSSTLGRVATSSDGVVWTERATGAESAVLQVCYNETLRLFCAVGNDGYIGTSTNAVDWQTQTGSFRAVNISGVASLESRGFVALPATAALMSSPDGVVWTATVAPLAFAAVKIYYSATFDGVFIPAANTVVYMFTNDGKTVTLGQGASSTAVLCTAMRYDAATDSLIVGAFGGFAVMPIAYDRTSEFCLPTMADTWVRAA